MARRSGQIEKRGDRKWLVRVFVGNHPDTGARVYRSETVHGIKRDAERVLNEMLRNADLGLLTGSRGATLGSFLDAWIETKERTVAPRTAEHYARFLDKFVRPALGTRRLDSLRPADIEALYSRVSQTASAHAQAHVHRVLHAALEDAVRLELIVRNPSTGAKVSREPRRSVVALNAEQAHRLCAELATRPRGLVFIFALATGMRPAEIQALRWSDCDLDAGTVTVERALVNLKGGVRQFGPTKTGKSRGIPLPRDIVPSLRTHRAEQAAHRLKLGELYEDQGLVFAAERGGPLDAQNLAYRVLKPALEAAGLPSGFRWYDCRHTAATLLLAAGVSAKIVAERLGHSQAAFTLDRYGHVAPGMQEQATERLGAMLFG